jgi:hypothetical protein
LISRSGPLSLIIGVSSSRYGTRLVKSVFAQSQQVCLAYCPLCGSKLEEFCPMFERCILVFICLVASHIALWRLLKLREWQCAAVCLFKLVATVLQDGEISIAMSLGYFCSILSRCNGNSASLWCHGWILLQQYSLTCHTTCAKSMFFLAVRILHNGLWLVVERICNFGEIFLHFNIVKLHNCVNWAYFVDL